MKSKHLNLSKPPAKSGCSGGCFSSREFELLAGKMERVELLLDNINLLISKNYGMPLPEIFKVKEAAAYLRLSVKRLYELLYAGKLQSLPHKKHHRLLFSKKQLNQYIYEKNECRISPEKIQKRVEGNRTGIRANSK